MGQLRRGVCIALYGLAGQDQELIKFNFYKAILFRIRKEPSSIY